MQRDILLVEIGTEELPPKALKGLSEAFTDALAGLLSEHDFSFGAVTGFASARRLAVQNRRPGRVTIRQGLRMHPPPEAGR